MQLSTDRKVILKVTNEDVQNGEFTIPGSVTTIGVNAFRGCTRLTQVTIPDSVTHIGDCAFFKCTSLTQVTIPGSVTSIGVNVFRGCTSLTQVTIPNSVKDIGRYAFSDCTRLTQVTIPDSVTHIGDCAFFKCTNLTQVTIPGFVTTIGVNAFRGCTSLTQVTIPGSVKDIGRYAFSDCTRLTQVSIHDSVTDIGMETFYGCTSLTQVTIPGSVTSIGVNVFRGCTSLTQVTIPSAVTDIGWWTFYGCANLTHVSIPNSVKSIGHGAFEHCSSLQVIAIEDREYQRLVNLLPLAQQHLARRWSELKAARDIKQQALGSVAACSMSGLTAHLVFRLLSDDGKIAGGHGCQVDTASFFKRLNHARQPALALNPDVSRLTIVGKRFPIYAERMLPRLCNLMAFRLNPTVAQIHLPVAQQELASLFGRVTETALPHARVLLNLSQRTQAAKASSVAEIEENPPQAQSGRAGCALM